MALTFTDGTITTTTTEDTIFDITSDKSFATWLFSHNMAVGDVFAIRVYVKDQNGATMRLYETYILSDAQIDIAKFIPFVPTKEYKVTIQKTAGTNRAFTWQRIEA